MNFLSDETVKDQTKNKNDENKNTLKIYEKIKIFITGYGPFMSVKNNPSELLANAIFSSKDIISEITEGKIQIIGKEIMEVTCEYVESKDKEIQDLMLQDKDEKTMKLILNFGVNTNFKEPKIVLEEACYNWINDYKTKNCKIVEDSIEKICSKLNLKEIHSMLNDCTSMSQDPGRYLCNYTYFLNSYAMLFKEHFYCEFIHIPDLCDLSTEQGLNHVCRFLESLSQVYCL